MSRFYTAGGWRECLGTFMRRVERRNPVGASTLAMVVNDNAGCLMPSGVLESIASVHAPTEGGSDVRSRSHPTEGTRRYGRRALHVLDWR
ncbi:hypothetical protein CES87_02185 [Pseudomonas sp. ERMR1:02]|nr:hypothetical protein CES87_02185 [Pseudomonas sp. ERMR1:02]